MSPVLENISHDKGYPGINRILISEEAVNDTITTAVLDSYPGIHPEIVEGKKALLEGYHYEKGTILLTRSSGEVLKPCPGTSRDYLCCNYWVINQTQNCPLNCTYCILRYYLNFPGFIIYTDLEKIYNEIASLRQRYPHRFFRLGTGELADSLALTGSRIFALELISRLRGIPDILLELKTKTGEIEQFLRIKEKQQVVLSWSLNPAFIIRNEEHGTALLQERLEKARQAQRGGFLIGLHFDPILHFPNWKRLYNDLIAEIAYHLNPEKIAWISMGSLRFPPETIQLIHYRFPHTDIIYEVFIRGMDGKLRYPKPLREELYKHVYQKLKELLKPLPFVYFCMESQDVWRHVLKLELDSNEEFEFLFATMIYRRFPHLFTQKPIKKDYLERIR